MITQGLQTSGQIRDALQEVMANYERIVGEAAGPTLARPWSQVAQEYAGLFWNI